MTRPVILLGLLLAAVVVTAPLQAQDQPQENPDPSVHVKAQLEQIANAYQAARQQRFAAGPAMDKLETLADLFITNWTGKVEPEVLATARTYRVRCWLTAEKYDKVFAEAGELLDLESLKDDDAYKLYYYRGMAAIQLGHKEAANECVEGLTALKPDIGAALKGAMAEKWPLVVAGELPPQWTLPRVKFGADDGTEGELALEDLRGKYVLLDFWATWCGPCKGLMARELQPLHKQWAGDDRFELVSIGTNWSGDTAVKQAQYAHDQDYHWTKVYDTTGAVTGDYGVRGIPTLTFIGPDGKVLAHGYANEVMPVVKETLAKLAAERAPGSADSQPEDTPEQPETDEEPEGEDF